MMYQALEGLVCYFWVEVDHDGLLKIFLSYLVDNLSVLIEIEMVLYGLYTYENMKLVNLVESALFIILI